MDEIRKTAARRGYLEFGHQLTIYNSVKNLESGWLRSTLLDAMEEWRIGTTELSSATALKDINYWLMDGDPSKKYQKIQTLPRSAEYLSSNWLLRYRLVRCGLKTYQLRVWELLAQAHAQ